jgi:hypothetical protein
LVQFKNALAPILVTVFPIVTPVKTVGDGTVVAGIEVVIAV